VNVARTAAVRVTSAVEPGPLDDAGALPVPAAPHLIEPTTRTLP
jgi:hypothetical protein